MMFRMSDEHFFWYTFQILGFSLMIYFVLWCLIAYKKSKLLKKESLVRTLLRARFQKMYKDVIPLMDETEKAEMEKIYSNTLRNSRVSEHVISIRSKTRNMKEKPFKNVRFNIPIRVVRKRN